MIRTLTRSRLQYLSFLGTLFFNSILEGGHTKLIDGQTSSTSRLTDCIVVWRSHLESRTNMASKTMRLVRAVAARRPPPWDGSRGRRLTASQYKDRGERNKELLCMSLYRFTQTNKTLTFWYPRGVSVSAIAATVPLPASSEISRDLSCAPPTSERWLRAH